MASVGGATGAVVRSVYPRENRKQPKDGKKGEKTNMKMQNTEMEFVTFDIQDVIATSGGRDLSGYSLISVGSLLADYNNSHDGYDFSLSTNVATAATAATNPLLATAYSAYAHNAYINSSYIIPYVAGTDVSKAIDRAPDSKYIEAKNINVIIDWIRSNQNYLQ